MDRKTRSITEPHAETKRPIVRRVTCRFSASAEQVFDAWLDPAHVGKWLFAAPTGKMMRVEIDTRVGGRFLIVERCEGVDVHHNGEYLVIDRPRHPVFNFGDEYLTDAARVQEERKTFEDGFGSMQQGRGGTFEQLAEYLAQAG